MKGKLELALLGNVEIHRDGIPVAGLTSSKAQALLCFLAVTGRPHLRPALAGLLWGEMPEENARGNLRKALANLRQSLGPHLQISRQAVAFNRDSPYSLDVELFDARVGGADAEAAIQDLQEAVELYRGDFLEGFYVRQAPAFEEWVLAQQTRLRELAVQALHTLAVHHTRQGQAGFAAGIHYTTRLLTLDPWREEAHRQLMLLLGYSGQRSAALVQYETCRRILEEELGVETAPETTALYRRIRDDKLDREAWQQALATLSAPMASLPFLSADPSHPYVPAPFVARELELAQLNGFLDLALDGQGQVVFVTGEAGSGKTALVREFARRAQDRQADLIVASGNCNAHTGIGDPYLPFREVLGQLTGDVEARWAAGEISREHARRLWALIPHAAHALVGDGPDLIDAFVAGPSLFGRVQAAAPGVAWLPDLERLVAKRDASSGRIDLRQRDLFEQYTRVLQTLSHGRPLLLVLDDLQWVDAGSLSLLFHLGRRLEHAQILIVGIYRAADVAIGRDGERHPLEPVVSEFQRRFGQIKVDVSQTEDQQFAEALLDTMPNRLGIHFRKALYERTRGHALFTVEMLRGMQERGDIVRNERGTWVEGAALDWEKLPARVDGVIGERIGRLPTTLQEALRVASVEGERFTAEVVARVRTVDEREIVQQLGSTLDRRHRLVRSQGSVQLGNRRVSRYRFRHILFQKYLYDSLDAAERIYLHEAVGNELERLYEGQTEEVTVELAHHFEEAGLLVKAVDYLHRAGQNAVRLSANEEAIAHLTRGLDLLGTLPDSPERARQELALLLALSAPLTMIRGYAAPEVEETYTRAQELCQQLGETPQLFPVLRGLWNCYSNRAELQRAQVLGEQYLSLAQEREDTTLLIDAHWMLGETFFFQGEMVTALAHLEQGIVLCDPQAYQSRPSRAVQHAGLACQRFAAIVLWYLGYPDQALARMKEALTLARSTSHPLSLVHAMHIAASLHRYRGELSASKSLIEASDAVATEHGLASLLVGGMMERGSLLVEQGEIDAGLLLIRQALDARRATGTSLVWQPTYLGAMAGAYLKASHAAQGLALLTEAFAVVDGAEKHFFEAELYRLKGELLLVEAETADETASSFRHAERSFRRAIDIARQQGSKSLELHAVMSLSRLWQGQGKKEEARQMLAQLYDWFSEGFDTSDLKEARALLEELAQD